MFSIIYRIKRQKFYYFLTHTIPLLIPFWFYRRRLNYWLKQAEKYPTQNINSRVSYYINPKENNDLKKYTQLKNFTSPKRSLYFFDLIQITKYFNKNYKIAYKFGDITENQEELTIVKSRPIDHSGNSVIMKLDSHRHFNFIKDPLKFEDKKNMIVWRGEIHKENRRLLVEKYYNHPQCNIGEVSKHPKKKEWEKDFLGIEEQLQYKFILSIEGIDVATNLKWILSSNSLCFMPKPKFETWFMEGKLIPNYHYVLVNDEYSDLIEKVNYYTKHPNKALEIIENANNWVAQFQDKKLEKTLSILVLNEYFKKTNQKN